MKLSWGAARGVRARKAVGLEFGSAFAFRICEAFEPDSNGLACRDVDTNPCLSNGPHSDFIPLVRLLLLCYANPFVALQISTNQKMHTLLNIFVLLWFCQLIFLLKGKAFAFAILPFVIESIFKVILVNDSSLIIKTFILFRSQPKRW